MESNTPPQDSYVIPLENSILELVECLTDVANGFGGVSQIEIYHPDSDEAMSRWDSPDSSDLENILNEISFLWVHGVIITFEYKSGYSIKFTLGGEENHD